MSTTRTIGAAALGALVGLSLVATATSATLRGTSSAERISGTRHADLIRAGGGADRVLAGRGGDRVYGGRGNDRLIGQSGRDRLYGQAGADVIIGGSGKDVLRGGPGDDKLNARDGVAETVHCGPGRDVAIVDERDATRGCELVRHPVEGGTGAGAADGWRYGQADEDSCFDAATRDDDRNGLLELVWLDIDNDCRWDTRLSNTAYGDDLLEKITYDMDENGVFEIVAEDINQRVGFEWIGFDLDQDGVVESRRIIPGSDLDVARSSNAQNLSGTLLHQFTIRTGGQSLAFPTFCVPWSAPTLDGSYVGSGSYCQ
jgi:hypothetical protein